MPEEPPGSEASAAGMYSLTDDDGLGAGSAGQCPSCGIEMAADAVICIECGYNISTGQTMGEAPPAPAAAPPPRRLKDQDDEAREEARRRDERAQAIHDVWVPLGLLILGVVLTLVQAYIVSTSGPSMDEMFGDEQQVVYEEPVEEAPEGQTPANELPSGGHREVMMDSGDILTGSVTIASALLGIAIQTALGVALMIPACFLAANLLDTGFGSLWTAILKLAAIYVAPTALGTVVAMSIPDPILSFMAALFIPVGLYYWFLSWLFGLDYFETIVTAAIMYVIKTWVVTFLVAIIWGAMG